MSLLVWAGLGCGWQPLAGPAGLQWWSAGRNLPPRGWRRRAAGRCVNQVHSACGQTFCGPPRSAPQRPATPLGISGPLLASSSRVQGLVKNSSVSRNTRRGAAPRPAYVCSVLAVQRTPASARRRPPGPGAAERFGRASNRHNNGLLNLYAVRPRGALLGSGRYPRSQPRPAPPDPGRPGPPLPDNEIVL